MTKKFLHLIVFLLLFTLVGCGQTIDKKESISMEDNVETEESSTAAGDTSSQQEVIKGDEPTEKKKTKKKKQPLHELKVHYIDVGQADATLFQWQEDNKTYTVLYDTGDWKRNDTVQYLQEQNVTNIDLIIISHPDADHIGQLATIIETFEVGEVWMSGNESSSKVFQRAIETILEYDIDYHEPRKGDIYDIGAVTISVLYPEEISMKANEESISIHVSYGDTSFLFTGDANKKVEKELIEGDLSVKAHVLQLGHHGSNTSSDPSFIKTVAPDVAIYSAGAGNSYGHPHAEVVSLIKNEGITLYGTDVHGTIIVTTDGSSYNVDTKKDGTIPSKNAKSTANNIGKAKPKQKAKKSDNCIDINNASTEELQHIIHIGPARAKQIIDGRPYGSVDDLISINGIGATRLEEIKGEGIACVGG